MNATSPVYASDLRRALQDRLDALEIIAHRIRWADHGFDPELIDRLSDVLDAARAFFGELRFLTITRDVLLHVASRRMVLDPAPISVVHRAPALAPFTRLSAQAAAMSDRVLAEMERLAAVMPSLQLEEVILSIVAAYEVDLPAAPGRAA